MKKIRKFNNNSLWWLEINLLNTNNFIFSYKKNNNIFYLTVEKNFYYFYFLILKNSLNTLLYYNLDVTLIKYLNNCTYYNSTQTIFCDFKIMIISNILKQINSISSIYKGNTWIEREIKEFYNIYIINLIDSRKLLLNYNYNYNLNYNQFNNIISDINI